MRSPLLLLLPILLFVAAAIFMTKADEQPTEEAAIFLTKLRSNDVTGAMHHFGDNTCHCAPAGGYIAYLQYESGQDPGLAFLLGSNFDIGKMRVEKLPYNGEKYLFPWDKPEDTIVYAPIAFAQNNRPYFLPLDMAFGYETSESQLVAYENDPSVQWAKGFTLRVRPTLEEGFIKPRDPKAPRTQLEKAAEDGVLPKEYAKYLHPKDPAAIKLANGQIKSASAVSDQLPRLQSIVVGLKMVRRGLFGRWAVQKVGVETPVIESKGKEFKLKE